ncbi:MAG: hypothetical protein ABIH89_06305, partial [Elusimicrobiota bacterium]
ALYLLSYLYGSMFAVDIKTGEKMWSVKVGAKPFGLVLRNDKAYVNSRAGIIAVDLSSVWGQRYGGN